MSTDAPDQTTNCPRCGKILPPNAPGGLCPYCLGALNLPGQTEEALEDELECPGREAEACVSPKR